jgi:hypothetical protein
LRFSSGAAPFPTWRDGPGHASLARKRWSKCKGGSARGDKEVKGRPPSRGDVSKVPIADIVEQFVPAGGATLAEASSKPTVMMTIPVHLFGYAVKT